MHLALASAPGSTHVKPGQPGKINNQDAAVVRMYNRGSIVVLCDGCGSQPHSGVGADIGAHCIASVLEQHLGVSSVRQLDWRAVCHDVLEHIRSIVTVFAESSAKHVMEQTVVERFLFTTIVFVTDEHDAVIAAVGDGVVIVDDEVTILEPPILNSPPYLSYRLLSKTAYHADELRQHLEFRIVATIDLSTVQRGVVVGTDGLKDLIGEDLHHPSLVQPKSLQRWLNALTTERIANGTFIPGQCHDDVSLAIVRTDAAQQRLIEERREVAELKQHAAHLEAQTRTLAEELNREALARSTAESRVSALEMSLRDLSKKAERSSELEKAVNDLEHNIGALRSRVHHAKGPLLATVDRFFTTVRGAVSLSVTPKHTVVKVYNNKKPKRAD